MQWDLLDRGVQVQKSIADKKREQKLLMKKEGRSGKPGRKKKVKEEKVSCEDIVQSQSEIIA
jgi:hypothetical protein